MWKFKLEKKKKKQCENLEVLNVFNNLPRTAQTYSQRIASSYPLFLVSMQALQPLALLEGITLFYIKQKYNYYIFIKNQIMN